MTDIPAYDPVAMAFGDLDPQTFPGEGETAGTSTGFEEITDLEEDFSYTDDVRSEIDDLPIGSLLWWEDLNYDAESSMASIMDYLADLTSVEDINVFAEAYQLKAYPNPVSHTATIEFTLKEVRDVHLTIYDAMGRGVRTITQQKFNPGSHKLQWDSRPTPVEFITTW